MPHLWITGGNTREVAEATGSITKNIQIVFALGQLFDQVEGHQMRKMTGMGQHFIVLFHIHTNHFRFGHLPQLNQFIDRPLSAAWQRCQNHLVISEQIHLTRMYTSMFCTRNWMPRHKTGWQIFTKYGFGCFYHITFGTADISQDDIFRQIRLDRF